MKLQTAAEIIARIDADARSHHDAVIAFDGDGTLWSGDVAEDIFFAMLERADFRRPALDAMLTEARAFQLELPQHRSELPNTLYRAYVGGGYPEERVCEFMAWGLAGWTRSDVAVFAAEVMARAGLGARLHAEVQTVMHWAQIHGLETFLVSASPRAIVEEAAKLVGIDAAHVIAATPMFELDEMLPAVERPIPYGAGKVTGLRQVIGARHLTAAFGDNVFDIAMLAEAGVPVAVRAKSRLREKAHDVPGIVELVQEGDPEQDRG